MRWFRRRRHLTLTEQTVRCPVHDCYASLTVRTDPEGRAANRHVDVAACSLLSQTSYMPPSRTAYFSDVSPPVGYLVDQASGPCHSTDVACSKPCLVAVNAAESWSGTHPLTCTSGMNDSLELARQTQKPTVMRLLWFYGS